MTTEYTGLAWHFAPLGPDGLPQLNYERRPLPVGEWLPSIEPSMCHRGYHASTRAIDALRYAPGPCVSLVEVRGAEYSQDDKLVAAERKHLWCYDASEELRRFARACALDVTHLWDPPNIVLQYLETDAEKIRAAARAAARGPAWTAARDAARDATRAAARDAAWDAAWDAARDAAWDAAWAAARAAAWDAAWEATRAAATRAAARDAQNNMLESLLIQGADERGLW